MAEVKNINGYTIKDETARNSIALLIEKVDNIEIIEGPQGPKGEDGKDGLTTSIVVNGSTYNHVDGTITLPNYPSIDGLATKAEVNELIGNIDAVLDSINGEVI